MSNEAGEHDRDGLERPDVFAYLNYREYLRDYYTFAKARRRLSYRGLARRAKISSPTFLKEVMEARRNLADETALRVAYACSLSGEGTDYFVALVRFNQAKRNDERRTAYNRLRSFQRYRKLHPLEAAQDAYHSRWYFPAVRELVASPAFVEDPHWVANALRPKIRPSEAKKALETLLAMALLERDDNGRLRQAEALVSTGPETLNVHLVNFHRTMMERAAQSIDDFPREERDISSVTLCVDGEGLERVKARLRDLRRELLEEELLVQGPREQVIQVNLQLFPLTAKLPLAEQVTPTEQDSQVSVAGSSERHTKREKAN